jgi:hypothetical protein
MYIHVYKTHESQIDPLGLSYIEEWNANELDLYTYICLYVYIYINIYTCVNVYTCICIHM